MLLFPYPALFVTQHFQNISSGTFLVLSVAITLCSPSVVTCFVPTSSALPSLCLAVLGFRPWLCVGWHLYLELVPFHGEGEWKKRCWRKREERKWGVDMQWMELMGKGRTHASRAKFQVNVYTKLSQYPDAPSLVSSVTVTTSLSLDSFVLQLLPKARWREDFFLILQPQCTVRESNRSCIEECCLVWALAFSPCKAFIISAPGKWSCWHIPVSFNSLPHHFCLFIFHAYIFVTSCSPCTKVHPQAGTFSSWNHLSRCTSSIVTAVHWQQLNIWVGKAH